VGVGWDLVGGAGTALGWWGLRVERSKVWPRGACGVEGAALASSPTSMTSSLLEEASDSSSSEGAGASG